MFAVPGWSVSASSLVRQKLERKSSKKGGHEKHSKKRKRDRADDEDLPQENVRQPDKSLSTLTKDGSEDAEAMPTASDDVYPDKRLPTANKAPKSHAATHRNSSQHKQANRISNGTGSTSAIPSIPPSVNPPPKSSAKLTPLQEKMRNKLTSARFRHLNEKLYTTSSSDALNMFTQSPELFAEYHAGFSQQVKDSWPQNPVDDYVKALKVRGALYEPSQGIIPLPRRKTGSCTIADLGCGDAPLARGCQSVTKTLKFKFHNFDLHAPNTFVTKADISDLPLRDGEADVAIFCLSLMGTNWINFVEEAWRVVRGDGKGEVWVAEVKSRFGKVVRGRVVENSVGKRRKKHSVKAKEDGDEDQYDAPEQFVQDARNADEQDNETDISNFVKVFTRRGFQLKEDSVNKNNKMFVSMVFFKTGIPTAGKHQGLKWNGKEYLRQPEAKSRFVNGQKPDSDINLADETKSLKPCVYKAR